MLSGIIWNRRNCLLYDVMGVLYVDNVFYNYIKMNVLYSVFPSICETIIYTEKLILL